MNIVKEIRKIWTKRVMICFALWAISSVGLTPIYVYEIESLYDIDIISHLFFGLWFGAMAFEIFGSRRLFISSLVCLIAFAGWEFVEISATIVFPVEAVINLFAEPIMNRIQDMVMDIAGFIIVAFIYINGGIAVTITTGNNRSTTYSL